MARRSESKNPVSGKKQLPRMMLLAWLFPLFLDVILAICFWSYCTVLAVEGIYETGVLRIAEWLIKSFSFVPERIYLPDMWMMMRTYWKAIALFDLVIWLLMVLFLQKYGHFKGVEQGSSHWQTRWERRVFRRRKKDPGVPLADKVYLTDKAHPANRNMLVLGAPGSGKSFTIIIPTLEVLTRIGGGRKQASFFCTDTKGALFRDTYRMMQGRGIKTFLLNLSNPWYSDRYNPLYNIHEERKYTEISELALAYTKNSNDEEASVGESIWQDTFRALMVAVWSYQYDFRRNPVTDKEETRAMWRTAELIRSLGVKGGKLDPSGELAQIVAAIRVTDPLHPTVENYDFIAAGAAETVASVIFTAGSKINVFTYPEIQSLTDGNDIPIDWICEHPGGIYLNFKVGSPYKAIAAVFIEQLLNNAYYIAETKYKDGRLPLDLQMCLDELPNICRVHSLPERLSTSRSYGINITVSIQSMQQLERMFNKAEETLKNNCVTHVYLGTGEQKALKEISEALGKTTTEEVSRSRNVGGKTGGGSDSDKAIGRELVFPAEIHSMPDQYAIVKIQHYQPIFAKKFPTAKQPWYPELGGQGCPENSCSIEDAYRIPSLIRQWQYYEQRLQRIERIREGQA